MASERESNPKVIAIIEIVLFIGLLVIRNVARLSFFLHCTWVVTFVWQPLKRAFLAHLGLCRLGGIALWRQKGNKSSFMGVEHFKPLPE